MILIYEPDLKVMKTYPHIKMNFLRQGFQNSSITDRHTGTPQTDVTKCITHATPAGCNNNGQKQC